MTQNDDFKTRPAKVTVFYDFCNIIRKTEEEVLSIAQEILDEARCFGEVVKAFAFTNTHTPPKTETALRLKGFYVIVCPPIKPPKDTGDETLKDFVNIMLEHIVDIFIIVSADGDFALLKSLVENRGRKFVMFHDGTISSAFDSIGCTIVNLREKRNQRPPQDRAENNNGLEGKQSRDPSLIKSAMETPAVPAQNPIIPDLLTEKHPTPGTKSSNGYSKNILPQEPYLAQITNASVLPKPILLCQNPYYQILIDLKDRKRTDTQTHEWKFLQDIVGILSQEYSTFNPAQHFLRKTFKDLVNEVLKHKKAQSYSLQDVINCLSAFAREEIDIIQVKTHKNSSQKYYSFNNQNPLLRHFRIHPARTSND